MKHEKHTTESHPPSGAKIVPLVLVALVIQIVLMIVLVAQVSTLTGLLIEGVPAGGSATQPSERAAPPTAAPTPTAPTAAPTPTTPVDMETLMDDDDIRGDPDAPVTIVEFSDYECPFCGRFYRDTLPQIKENFIDTGKVKLIYRDYPLNFHQNAQKSAEAAECAGDQGKYYNMHDLLFEKGVAGGVASYKQFAADLGLDTTEFNDCLDSGKHAAEISKDMADGQAAGIRGTPGFIINGQLVSGAQPYPVFESAINAALG